MPAMPDRVFKQPKLLSDDSRILGIPAKGWDRVLLGDMEKEMQRLRRCPLNCPLRQQGG